MAGCSHSAFLPVAVVIALAKQVMIIKRRGGS